MGWGWQGSLGGAVPKAGGGCSGPRGVAPEWAVTAKGPLPQPFVPRLGLGTPRCKALAGGGTTRRKNTNELQKGAWSNGNVHHLNNAFDNFYPGSSSQFKGNDTSFQGFTLSCSNPWLVDSCMVSSSPIFLCSITPDLIPSEMSPSCKNGLIIQRSCVSNSVKYYKSIHKWWSLKIRPASHAIVCSTRVRSKKF